LYSSKCLTEADGAAIPFNLEYYIFESETDSEKINMTTYGLEIIKTQCSDGIEYTETKKMREICTVEKVIYEIAKILSDNTVTPICFEEVVKEIMQERETNKADKQTAIA